MAWHAAGRRRTARLKHQSQPSTAFLQFSGQRRSRLTNSSQKESVGMYLCGKQAWCDRPAGKDLHKAAGLAPSKLERDHGARARGPLRSRPFGQPGHSGHAVVLVLLPVDGADEVALLLEALGEVGGDEAAGAGHANLHLLVALGELLLGDGGQNLRRGEAELACAGWTPCACAGVSCAGVRVRTAHRSTCVVLCESRRRILMRGRHCGEARTMATWCFLRSHRTREPTASERPRA